MTRDGLGRYSMANSIEKDLGSPRVARNDIVSALSAKLSIFDELCCRIINFHFACFRGVSITSNKTL